MTVIRHAPATSPTNIPKPGPEDITTDHCVCGAGYSTRNGDPDRELYSQWLDHHVPHLDENP
jgi:hypothetical protein